MIYTFNLLINIFFIYFFLTLLVNQYYSIKRFIKVCIQLIIKDYKIIILSLLFSLFGFISVYFLYIINITFFIFFIKNNKPIKIKFTRRNISLFLVSGLIGGLIVPISIVSSLISIIIGYLLTFKIETLIRNYYFKKARDKIKKVNPIIIGITGSYGKTTFKNILLEVLKTKYIVKCPSGNINTPLGVSKFINEELTLDTELLILELGIDEVNGMKKFKKIISLDIGVITSIGENHLSTFKNMNNTFIGKMKIKELLKDNGILFLNNDSIFLNEVKENNEVYKYSKDNMIIYPIELSGRKLNLFNQELIIPLFGEYVYSYVDGVVKISEFLGVNKDYIIVGLKNIKQISRRCEIRKYKEGVFINDSYNININGVKESLKILDYFKGENVVIIGGIIEQGKLFIENNNIIKNLLEGYNVIFIGEADHPLVINHKYKSLKIVSSLIQAYAFIEDSSFINILQLAKGEDIYLK